jgi:ribosomal protein S5
VRLKPEGVVSVGKTDGLVGVARGGADTLELAQSKAMTQVRYLLQLPEAQARLDVGGRVGMALALLDEKGVLGVG